jgi:ACR3 family arsenite efflux pump ArsB
MTNVDTRKPASGFGMFLTIACIFITVGITIIAKTHGLLLLAVGQLLLIFGLSWLAATCTDRTWHHD